jgi:hypothetical protein
MSGVIANLVTGVPHGSVMAGKTHCLCTNDRVFLELSERGFPVFDEKGGNPAIVADGTFFGGICTFGELKLCCYHLGDQAEEKGEDPGTG